jgi:hypothetical protein
MAEILERQVRDLKRLLAEKERLQNELLHMHQGLLSVALDAIEKLEEKIRGLEATISQLALTFAEPVSPMDVSVVDEEGLAEHEAQFPPESE